MATKTSKRIGTPIPTSPDEFTMESGVDLNRPQTREEILWTTYSIRPNLPLRSKVEQLVLLWRLTAPAIANLLDIETTLAQDEIAALNEEWLELGQPLDETSSQMVRGRLIAELNRLKADLDAASAGNPDARLLGLKLQLIDKLTRLQGIELDRKDTSVEEVTLNPVEAAIATLTPEARAELMSRLKKPTLPPAPGGEQIQPQPAEEPSAEPAETQ